MDASPVVDPRTEDEPRLLLVLAGVLSAVVTAVDAVRQDLEKALGVSPGPRPASPTPDVVIGVLVGATGRASSAGAVVLGALRPVATVVVRPPLLPERLQLLSWFRARGRQGQAYRKRAEPLAQTLMPTVTSAIIDSIDIDAIVARVDLDAIVARIDIDAVLDRIDLAALVRQIIEEIDLPDLIRETSGAVSSEAVVGIRMQGIQADERVSRIVDKILQRRGERKTSTPVPVEVDDGSPS